MTLRTSRTAMVLLLAGCVSHRVRSEPIEIKPIHITMDINLRVQRELDEFFAWEDTDSPEEPAADRSGPEEATEVRR
ncbi:MAG TPA: hypothetical protein VK081_07810 [Planctomycetota bacterium]|nr:hypothetical protein [Planctomycetota bacterium]